MKKIIILVDQLYKHGGIEKLVAVKANYWHKVFNYHITIISTNQNKNPFVYHFEKGIKHIDLNINYKENKSFFSPDNLVKMIINSFKIKKLTTKLKPDFVLVASHIPLTYTLPFLMTKAKIIKEYHFTKYFINKNHTLKQKIFNKIEKRYDFQVVLSNEEQLFYSGDNVTVIPNPIVNPIVENKNQTVSKTHFTMILRFAPVKRIEFAIAIWKELVKENHYVELHLYGDDSNIYAQEIQQLVKDNKLEKLIIFKGQTADISKVLLSSKALLLTSMQECFPMVILEAMSQGVPTLAVDCPTGPRNIIQDNEDGILLIDNQKKASQQLIKFIVDLPLQEKIAHNALVSSKRFNLARVMKMWKNKIFEL